MRSDSTGFVLSTICSEDIIDRQRSWRFFDGDALVTRRDTRRCIALVSHFERHRPSFSFRSGFEGRTFSAGRHRTLISIPTSICILSQLEVPVLPERELADDDLPALEADAPDDELLDDPFAMPFPGERDLEPDDLFSRKRKRIVSSDDEIARANPTMRAYLVGVEAKNAQEGFTIHDSLLELAELARTAGLEVIGSTYQNLSAPHPSTYIGTGKAKEIRSALRRLGSRLVVFDDELSPAQLRNLERVFGESVRVVDRTQLILDIFAQRAQTREGKLQVDLAQHVYMKPRLTSFLTSGAGMEARGGGMQGGVGIRGVGETQLELDRRLIDKRITRLRRQIEEVRRHRQLYRSRRESVPISVVSIVGYTNAGKSTLLNAVTGSEVLAEDKLFATLDPTTRRVKLPDGSRDILFTDTVGFIQKLPTTLVAAFRATLEEVKEAEVLLHVVDVSHPMRDAQMQAVWQVLDELGVMDKPQIIVWNKSDLLSEDDMIMDGGIPVEVPKCMYGDRDCVEDAIAISARTGQGLDKLLARVHSVLQRSLTTIEVRIPLSDPRSGEVVNLLHETGDVEAKEWGDDHVWSKAHVPFSIARRLAEYRIR